MASQQLSVAIGQARTFLNDNNATVWTDANLLPCMQQAHYELQTKLWEVGSPVIRAQTEPLLVPSGYNPNINANLPTDFLIPTIGSECGQVSATLTQVAVSGGLATYSFLGSSGNGTVTAPQPGMIVTITGFVSGANNVVDATIVSVVAGTSFTVVQTTQVNETHAGIATMPDNVWIPLTEQFFLPLGQVLGPTLTWWSWQEEELLFSGSTINRYVVFQYRHMIPIPTGATSPIGITFGEMYLGARGAAIAAGSLGNTAATTYLDARADMEFGKVVLANRGQQKPMNRP